MDKQLYLLRYNSKRKKVFDSFNSHFSLRQLAASYHTTRQATWAKIKRYDLLNEWKSHLNSIKLSSELLAPKSPGIYFLYFTDTPQDKYYGSTKNLYKRIQEHLSSLKSGINPIKKLQNAFNLFGVEKLQWETKECPEERLLYEERLLIKKNPTGFNSNIPFIPKNKNASILDQRKRYIDRQKALPKKKSKYRFVSWVSYCQSWKAQPTLNKKQYYLGYFKNEEDAKATVDTFIATH
jgi:predicted GIY-YIG superfamily endonuclease